MKDTFTNMRDSQQVGNALTQYRQHTDAAIVSLKAEISALRDTVATLEKRLNDYESRGLAEKLGFLRTNK